jgi:hypothetical protein
MGEDFLDGVTADTALAVEQDGQWTLARLLQVLLDGVILQYNSVHSRPYAEVWRDRADPAIYGQVPACAQGAFNPARAAVTEAASELA